MRRGVVMLIGEQGERARGPRSRSRAASGATTVPPRARSTYPMAMSVGCRDTRERSRARPAACGAWHDVLRVGDGRDARAAISWWRAQIEQRVDPPVLSLSRARGVRVGDPARAVDDERVPMLALAQRERDRPAPRAFVARERRRVGVPSVEVARDGDAPRVGRIEHQTHESQRVAQRGHDRVADHDRGEAWRAGRARPARRSRAWRCRRCPRRARARRCELRLARCHASARRRTGWPSAAARRTRSITLRRARSSPPSDTSACSARATRRSNRVRHSAPPDSSARSRANARWTRILSADSPAPVILDISS